MDIKVSVPYEHEVRNLSTIYLAITTGSRPSKDGWRPAYRDTVDGVRVVWARFPTQGRRVTVWLRDRNGERAIDTRVV